MPKIVQTVLAILWNLQGRFGTLLGFLAKLLATILSYFGGLWVCLLVAVLLFGGEAAKRLAPPREDEGR